MKNIISAFWLLLIMSVSVNTLYAQSNHTVTYQVNEQDYEGYYVSAGADAPLVMIIHDWDGLTEYEVRRAHMLARLGYSVFAADLYGKGIRPTEINDKKQQTSNLYNDREKMRELMIGALAAAREQGANTDNAVAMGYCFGGAAVLELARSGAGLKGYAPFHGGLATPEGQDYSKTQGSIIVFHGTADKMISMDEFAGLAKELETAGIDHEMISYSQAVHAFTVFSNPERYNKAADKKSWNRFVEFLDEQLSD